MSLPITTERLVIRPYTMADIPTIHTVLYGNATARRLTGGASSPAETRAVIEGYIERQATDGYSFWTVVERETGLVIGEAGLKPFDEEQAGIELGYAFGPAYWGRGYATEAGRAVIREAFGPLGLSRVVAVTDDDNTSSLRVLNKLGFVPAGRRMAYGRDLPLFVLGRS